MAGVGGLEKASKLKRKGMACTTGLLEVVPVGMGERGRGRGRGKVDDTGQSNTTSCKWAPPRPATMRS